MIAAWLPALAPLLVGIVVLALPGLAVGLSLRLRGWWLAGLAAPLSLSLIVVASVLAPLLGIRWGATPVAALTLVAVVAGVVWARFYGRAPRRVVARVPFGRTASLLALGLPAGVIAWNVARSVRSPELIAQRYDNFFHLNAIPYILDHGNASPFFVGSLTTPGMFYPSGWHAYVSLIDGLTGAGAPVSSSVAVLVVSALVWPSSAILLVRTLFGRSAIVTVAAGAVAAGFPAFPYLPLHYGPLYPLFLGLAIAPAMLAVLAWLARPGAIARRQDAALLALLILPGLAVAHPGAMLAAVVLSLPMLLLWLLHAWRRADSPRSRVLVGAGALTSVLGVVLLLQLMRPDMSQIYWPTTERLTTAIGSVLTGGVYGYDPTFLIAIAGLVGAVAAVRRPTYGRLIALGAFLVGSTLYVIVAASGIERLRTLLTASWYNNTPRLAAMWVIAAIPLAVLGCYVTWRWIERRARVVVKSRRPMKVVAASAGTMVAVIAALLTQGGAMDQVRADLSFVYYPANADGPILSAGEYKLMRELDDLVPKEAVIAGDPWTGAGFAYGISDRKVLNTHLLMTLTPDIITINNDFKSEGDSPRVCQALQDTGVRYILDFAGGPFQKPDQDFSGVRELRSSPYVELVKQEPGAALYRITSCGLAR